MILPIYTRKFRNTNKLKFAMNDWYKSTYFADWVRNKLELQLDFFSHLYYYKFKSIRWLEKTRMISWWKWNFDDMTHSKIFFHHYDYFLLISLPFFSENAFPPGQRRRIPSLGDLSKQAVKSWISKSLDERSNLVLDIGKVRR